MEREGSKRKGEVTQRKRRGTKMKVFDFAVVYRIGDILICLSDVLLLLDDKAQTSIES